MNPQFQPEHRKPDGRTEDRETEQFSRNEGKVHPDWVKFPVEQETGNIYMDAETTKTRNKVRVFPRPGRSKAQLLGTGQRKTELNCEQPIRKCVMK